MEQLCLSINMPPEVTRRILEIHAELEEFPCQELLMHKDTWEEGLQQLKDALGEDPGGFRRLCCMLRCALKVKQEYARLGISDTIYTDTMAAFSRFVREHMESYGTYGFDRGFWTTRQISGYLFRIGQLEFERYTLSGAPAVSLHIPTDVDLRPEILVPSLREGLAAFYRIFPDHIGKPVYCHSWLLSPQLKDFLPEGSNILAFQQLFDLEPEGIPGQDVLLWVFKNPKLPPEQYPENTSLQRKLKQFFLNGGQFREGKGYLRIPV